MVAATDGVGPYAVSIVISPRTPARPTCTQPNIGLPCEYALYWLPIQPPSGAVTRRASGKPLSPGIYATIVRAGYAGIKAGNRRAVVGIGETSPRGRLKPTPEHGRIQDTIAPGLFAQLLSEVKPRVKFDAWAHHPYSALGTGPTQRVRFPNVNLPQIPLFQKSLDTWFKRKNTKIWITEYGFETKPGEPKGVTNAQQASYARQALAMAKKFPNTQMFVWFIFRDQPVSLWQSGLERQDASRKPSFSVFSAAAKSLDVRNPVVLVKLVFF